MEEMVTLELTRGEILMLQELTSDTDCDYEWGQALADGISRKLQEAYQKPAMNAGMFRAILEAERALWKGEPVADRMVREKEAQIRFLYDVEEAE